VNFKVAITEIRLQIAWNPVADP